MWLLNHTYCTVYTLHMRKPLGENTVHEHVHKAVAIFTPNQITIHALVRSNDNVSFLGRGRPENDSTANPSLS